MVAVLVVEDTPSELKLIVNYLTNYGYTVVGAADAKEALDQIAGQKFDAIVTDLVMPGMSGLELCRSLRKNPETARTPIVACTTKDQEIDRLWAMKQGVSAYITKPFTSEELVCALRSVAAAQ